jgi:hypothetical protein
MNSKRLPLLVLLLLLGGVAIAATSTIDLTGSDSAPTEIRVATSCLTDQQYVPTVIDAGNGGDSTPTPTASPTGGNNGNGNGGGNDNPNGGGNGNLNGNAGGNDNSNGGGNHKLTAVEVRGSYKDCAGSQIQVIVALTDGRVFYAVRAITDNSQTFTFRFDVHDGDFTDTAPRVINGVLTSQGGRVPPPPNKLVSDIQALVSNDWN